METKEQLLATLDATIKQVKFKVVKAFVIIAQDVIDKINRNEKTSAEDLRQLREYTEAMDNLLADFFQLLQLQNTPVFTAHEQEITKTLAEKTDKELLDFRNAYENVALKVNGLLQQINARN